MSELGTYLCKEDLSKFVILMIRKEKKEQKIQRGDDLLKRFFFRRVNQSMQITRRMTPWPKPAFITVV